MFRRFVSQAMYLASLMLAPAALAQSTAFTYQGLLKDGGSSAQGPHDFRFRLFDAASGGTQVGSTQCVDNTLVKDGVFTTTVDFGAQFTTTAARFIEIMVRKDTGLDCSNTTGYATLTPRQPITPAPTATQAASAFSLAAPDGTPAKAVFVDNDGKVGIGTTAPTHTLHIASPAPTLALQDTDSSAGQVGYISYRDSANVERGWIGYGSAGDPDLSIINTRALGDIVLNPFSGNVGIGTASPLAKLHVSGGTRLDVPSIAQNLNIHDAAGNKIWKFGLVSNTSPILYLTSPVTGDDIAGFFRTGDGTSVVFADEKNFRAPNPSDPTTDIWYCCPEGPEAAMYMRGTARLVAGRAVVQLPQHFRDLASPSGMTVQVTPLAAESKGLAVTAQSLNGVVVVELGSGVGNYEFNWRVEAVRKGYEDYQVIRPWMRSDEDESKAWSNRLKWIAERKAQRKP